LAVSLLLGIAFLATRRSGPPSTARAPVRPSSPDQARTDELLRLNTNLPSDPALASEYQAINLEYFEGRLPAIGIRWEPRLAEVGPLIAEGFRLEGATNGRLILLNPSLQDDEQGRRRTLCHEIVHVAVRDRDQEHGAIFQSRLRQLSEQGAFLGTVATEEEKQELQRTIATQMSELRKAEVTLQETRAKLDVDTVRVQAQLNETAVRDLQSRADFYNADIQRFNMDVERLNRMIEDYNLMISYPDGLDRERMAQRTAMPGAK
jgi:hypothetical protein